MSQNGTSFSGYRWDRFSSLPNGRYRSQAERFLSFINWEALIEYATKQRNGVQCIILDDIGLGGCHMVRILEFEDGKRWVARLRLPSLTSDTYSDIAEAEVKAEVSTIALVLQKTQIPVPRVHAFEASHECDIKAPFMLMDCLEGNVGMDLGMKVPYQHRGTFFKRLAEIHVELSTIRLPKIGKIIAVNADGSFEQGPIPGLGGPFQTATEFFKAWSDKTGFGISEERLKDACGEYFSQVLPSVLSFPESISAIADKLSICDQGPFPLFHGDFGHNNVIVDDDYNVLGLIDWDFAFAAPWELSGNFPLTLQIIPPAMDVPWNYDEAGNPVDEETIQDIADQRHYIATVKAEEENRKLEGPYCLSNVLEDHKRQHIATAMRLYKNGKAGWYSKVADQFLSQLQLK